MNCCTECFSSPNLKNRINREANKGTCDFCGLIGISITDARTLFPSFESIFNQYNINDEGSNASQQLNLDFPNLIFSDRSIGFVDELLHAIFADQLTTYKEFLEEKIALTCKYNAAYAADITSLEITWEKFVEEIKAENRFHIKSVFDFGKLKRLLETNTVNIPRGRYFYRGRLSEKIGFPVDQMGNPPNHLAKSGRANPVGISYLYVANDRDTTLFETRATLHDYISIGEFLLLEDIEVIDLKDIGGKDPFDLGENDLLSDYLAYKPFLQRLSYELSRPIRRNDSELDYLPTQYLTEFIKSTGADGVGYGSSLNPTGLNLVIFYPNKLECRKVEIHEITEIYFKSQELTL